jgi:uncharacterized membrane protein YfcA
LGLAAENRGIELELTLSDALVAICIVTLGTAVQASVGFGLGLIAAPLLALIDPAFVPAPVLLVAVILATLMAYRERWAIDLRGLKMAIAGRLVGAAPAAVSVKLLSAAAFEALFGVLVLAAVGISLVRREIQPTPRAVFMAGIASAFMSTAAAIGGPPMALIYQNAQAQRLRATLAALFCIGCIISLVALALVGRVGADEVVRAGVLVPGIPLGLLMAGPVVRILDRNATKPLILTLSSLAALAVLGRALL